jgi:hypothetical protein
MTFLIPLFAKIGLPERFQRAAAIATTILAAIALLAVLKTCYDRSVVERHQAKVEAQASKAREKAADERAVDAVTNAKSEKELQDAIKAAPGGSLSPAAHALACERLRRLGRTPPACRPASGDGT